MKLIKLSVLFFLLLFSAVSSGSVDSIWAEANRAYDRGEYDRAIEGYLKLLERGHRQPAVYYNLGNSYFKSGRLGYSIAAYGHSLKLDPSFEIAQENLEYVRKFVVDKVEKKPRGFLINLWYAMAGLLSPDGFFILTIVIYWIICSIITLLMLRIGRREFLTYLLILCLVVFILGAVITRFVINEKQGTRRGVVVVPSVELREGPGTDFERIFTCHEGLEFKIYSQRQDYYLIELVSGLKGWIPKTTLAEI